MLLKKISDFHYFFLNKEYAKNMIIVNNTGKYLDISK